MLDKIGGVIEFCESHLKGLGFQEVGDLESAKGEGCRYLRFDNSEGTRVTGLIAYKGGEQVFFLGWDGKELRLTVGIKIIPLEGEFVQELLRKLRGIPLYDKPDNICSDTPLRTASRPPSSPAEVYVSQTFCR